MGSVVGTQKTYNSALNAKFDLPAKLESVKFLEQLGCVLDTPVTNQPNAYHKYDYLIRIEETGKILKIECEVKSVWKHFGKFVPGWYDVQVMHRKIKSQADFLIMFNETLDSLAFMKVHDMKNSPVGTLKRGAKIDHTKQIVSGECVFQVPFDKVEFYKKLPSGKWERFKI